MPTSFHLHGGWVAAEIVAIGFMLLYPLALALIARTRLGVSWRYFGFGALIFLLFQILTRIPLTTVVGAVFGKQIKASPVLLWSWLAVLVVTAGLFEEVGRYIGYRWLMRREDKTWNKAVMYGLGHGGLESMLLVGGTWAALAGQSGRALGDWPRQDSSGAAPAGRPPAGHHCDTA